MAWMRRGLMLFVALGLILAGSSPAHAQVVAQQVVGSLAFPAAFTFAPDGRIFYAERFSGEIRIYDPATGQDSLFHTLPQVATSGEQGVLGLALHPSYPARPLVYAYYTRTGPQNVIVQIGSTKATGSARTTILTLPAATIHNGGVLHFGPDRMLYAVVGDAQNPANAQNLGSLAGKVLRMTETGGAPKDGPFPGSLVYSFGHRNMFGFGWDPLTGKLWLTENGPTCNDEVNLVIPRGNYAWGPNQTCSGTPPGNTNQDGPQPRLLPEVFYSPPLIAPTGGVFCQGCGLPGHEGNFIFGAWNDGVLRSLTLDAERDDVASQSVLFDHTSGVLAVERGPNGSIYFSDSDQIFRVVAK
jgi:glucose/arabinose dehydrogenase